MVTTLAFQTWSGGTGYNDPSVVLGYCSDRSPQDILREVFETHAIHQYRDLYRPVDWHFPNNALGLQIENAEERVFDPSAKPFASLDLRRALLRPDQRRTEKTYMHALKKAIAWHLDVYHSNEPVNYLDTREQDRNERKEALIEQLLEVAQITLEMEGPTVNDLKHILRS